MKSESSFQKTSQTTRKNPVNQKKELFSQTKEINDPYTKTYYLQRIQHVPLSAIHPEHNYNDPRKEKEQNEPTYDDLKIEAVPAKFSSKLQGTKQGKTSLPEHLVTPYCYIQKVRAKSKKNRDNYNESQLSHSKSPKRTKSPADIGSSSFRPSDIWNPNTRITSSRVNNALSKQQITDLTMQMNWDEEREIERIKNELEEQERLKQLSANKSSVSYTESMLKSNSKKQNQKERKLLVQQRQQLYEENIKNYPEFKQEMQKITQDETQSAQIISLFIDRDKEQKRLKAQEIDLNLQPNLYKSQLEKQFYNIVDKPAPELSQESKMQMMKNSLFNESTKENQEKQLLISEIVAPNPCKLKFQKLVSRKDKLLQEKRIMAKFFKQFLEEEISFNRIENMLVELEEKRQKETEIITVKFLKEFKGQKQYFKESSFTLYEVGNFLTEQKITQEELQIISGFLSKVKKLFNLRNGNRLNINLVDPNLKIEMALLDDILDIQCQKAIYENEVVNDCIEKIFNDLDRLATQHKPNSTHVIGIFERNVIVDTALKYFKQLDRELFDQLTSITRMHKFMVETEEQELNLPVIHSQLQLLLGEITEKDLVQKTESPTFKFLSHVPRDQKTIKDDQIKRDLQFFERDQNIPTKDQETDNLISLLNNNNNKKNYDNKQPELLISQNFLTTPKNEIKLQRRDPLQESYVQSCLEASQLPQTSQYQPLSISSAFYHPSYEFKTHTYDPEEEKKRVEEIELEQLRMQKEEEEEDPNLRLSGLLKKQKNMEQSLKMQQSRLAPEGNLRDQEFKEKLSCLKATVDTQYYKPNHIGLGRYKSTSDKFLDYQTYFPTDYYSNLISPGNQEDAQGKPKDWYLRSHHIETLTEHPFSQKDNVMDTKYAAFLSSLPKNNAFTQPEEVQQSQETKQQLIDSLEGKIGELKNDLVIAKTQLQQQQQITKSPQESQKFDQIQRYYDSIQKNEKKELLSGTYQSLLDDLRQQEKNILNQKRGNEITQYGPPKDKWWEDKTSEFNANLKKYGQSLSQKKNHYDDIYQSLSVKELY